MIELSRAQDEEVGDGTTSVIILAGEVLSVVEGFLEKEIHPTTIVTAYFQALEDIKKLTNDLAIPINMENNDDVAKIVGGLLAPNFHPSGADLSLTLQSRPSPSYTRRMVTTSRSILSATLK